MKYISIIIALTLAIFLFSCSADEIDESVSTNADVGSEIKDEHTDKALKDDWKNIQTFGEHDVGILFVNVGKADSIILSIDGSFYMIDTGTSESVPYTLAALDSLGVDSLEGVFLTHPDRDHIGGYTYIRDAYEIKHVYSSSICGDMYVLERTTINDTLIKLDPGEVIEAADGVFFEVLGPIKYNSAEDNNNSLVLRLTVNGVTVLFAGDMKDDEETTLLNSEMGMKCDILKVGHHGRKDATSEEFIKAAQPNYAVISTSTDEEERSANKKVLELLEQNNCEYFITEDYDLGILLTIEKDGKVVFENYTAESAAGKVKIKSVSKEQQTVTLKNKDDCDVDISGWYITSDRGGEVYCFPEGTVIKKGEQLTLSCKGYDGDIIWNETNVWHESKDDTAYLIDSHGNLIDSKLSE